MPIDAAGRSLYETHARPLQPRCAAVRLVPTYSASYVPAAFRVCRIGVPTAVIAVAAIAAGNSTAAAESVNTNDDSPDVRASYANLD
jgi:hypothetical protein